MRNPTPASAPGPDASSEAHPSHCSAELRSFDYVSSHQMASTIATSMNIPSPLEQQVKSLEKEMLEPGRAFARMEIELKAIQSKKAGHSVSAGTYTFKDKAATGAWAAIMGKRDIVKYFADARQQLGSLNTMEKTESQTLQEEADA